MRNRESLEPADHAELTMLLSKFSKVFFTDINLYDLNGNLLATSRPKVFEEGLVSSRMDPTAFLEMTVNKRSEFVHSEQIGKLDFLAAYAPFRNDDRELMAYLSCRISPVRMDLNRRSFHFWPHLPISTFYSFS